MGVGMTMEWARQTITTTTATATTTTNITITAPNIDKADVAMSNLKNGELVIIQALKSASAQVYNEKVGEILSFDDNKGRYKVLMIAANKELSIRPRNLRRHPPSTFTSGILSVAKTANQKKVPTDVVTTATTATTVTTTSTATTVTAATITDQSEKDSFFSTERKNKIIYHMNKDHSESLKAYLHYFNKMPQAMAAIMTDVDSRQMTVDVTLEDGTQEKGVKINFLRQLVDSESGDVRKMTVEMHKIAFKELEWIDNAGDHDKNPSEKNPENPRQKNDENSSWKRFAIPLGFSAAVAALFLVGWFWNSKSNTRNDTKKQN